MHSNPPPAPKPWTEEYLESQGFNGWTELLKIGENKSCPSRPGVYAVTYRGAKFDSFPSASCGGHFKGRDPTISDLALRANWVEEADIVYIGKANSLSRRLKQFADFGAGKPVGHWGGRLIWQLPSVSQLFVAWKETPNDDPLLIESKFIAMFRETHGKPPFANAPNRLGM